MRGGRSRGRTGGGEGSLRRPRREEAAGRAQRPALSVPLSAFPGRTQRGAELEVPGEREGRWPARLPPHGFGKDGSGPCAALPERTGEEKRPVGEMPLLVSKPRFALGVVLVMREVCWMSRAVI